MRRSLALFATSALLPIVILAAILGTYGYQSRRAAIEDQARSHAAFIATLVGRELLANKHAVQMIAQSPALDGPIDEKRFAILAQRLIADEPLWRIISVASIDGIRLADAPTPISGIPHGPVVDLESLQRAVATHHPTVGRSMAGQSGHVAFAVRAPVIRDGRVVYIVSTIVNPKTMGDLLLTANLPEGWTIEIIDQAGNIVAQAGSSSQAGDHADAGALRALGNQPGSMYREQTQSGMNRIATWKHIPGSLWTVHVGMPAAVYNAPITRASVVLFGGIFTAVGLAVLLAWLLARELKQQRLREAAATEGQRLEALGRMTGGVAHDFNNLLTPVIGGLDMLQRRLADDPKSLRLAEMALVSAERARTLVSRLLAFSRRQVLEPRDVDISALLKGVRDLIERSVGKDVQTVFDIPDEVISARVDPAQLELAILNLAVNARDAMPSGGTLTISVETELVSLLSTSGLAPGSYVRIKISDTGAGMDAATLAHAIDPFFTTKAIGKGTGLGLSMVHGLAAQSGGRLILFSKPGLGTVIEIWLPSGGEPIAVDQVTDQIVDARCAHLLLVDDHDLVRRATARLLREHGHTLAEAQSAEEALALLRGDTIFEGIVTDYAMPGKSGIELAEEARALIPDIPILLITGFADANDPIPADLPRMIKPFRGPELLAQVSAMLKRGDQDKAS
jgi:signal transduction histidine kinase/CheY-like chemotaxis protein